MKDLHTDASEAVSIENVAYGRGLTARQTSLALLMVAFITWVLRRVKSQTESYVYAFSLSARLRIDRL